MVSMRRSLRGESAILILAALFALGAKCGDGGSVNCPPCDGNVTWTSYGDRGFGNEGPDSTVRKILDKCDWDVHSGHNGGVGNTLQITSCEEGATLVWAFNDFSAYRVADGWTGQTEREIRIGDTLADVLAAEPSFRRIDSTSYMISEGDIRVEANFATGRLEELIVGHYYRR